MDQVFHPVVMRAFLTMRQVFDHPLALQQVDDLGKTILQAVLAFLYFNFGHRRTPLPAAEHAGRINQSIRDWQSKKLSNYWVSPWKYSKNPGGLTGVIIHCPHLFKTRNLGKNKRLQYPAERFAAAFPPYDDSS
ncbi:hypothetical protein QNM99_29505 [Pseudomonas sp. PCH446]